MPTSVPNKRDNTKAFRMRINRPIPIASPEGMGAAEVTSPCQRRDPAHQTRQKAYQGDNHGLPNRGNQWKDQSQCAEQQHHPSLRQSEAAQGALLRQI